MQSSVSRRVLWADVLRAFALYAVYLAHRGTLSSYISSFCFGFVMQLFFFVSGLFASHYRELPLPKLIKKLALGMLVPHIALCLINLGWYAMRRNPGVGKVALECLFAIRGQMRFSALWFLPCLIVMTLLYALICRIVKKPAPRLILCLILSLGMRIFKETSQWFWSADSAFLFLFYYACGDLLMPYLSRIELKKLSPKGWLKLGLVTAPCLALTVYSFFLHNMGEKAVFGIPYSDNALRIFVFIASAAAIEVLFVLSLLLQRSRLLQNIGKNTLISFAIQGIGSEILFLALWYLGISWTTWADWQVLFYGAAELCFTVFCLAIPLKKLLPFLFGGKVRKKQKAVSAA